MAAKKAAKKVAKKAKHTVPEPDGLNAKQIRFCQEYLIDSNATQAAIRAGYSEKSARNIGCEHLTKPNILRFIRELKEMQALRTSITADRVLAEYARIAFADIRSIYHPDGTLKKPEELDDNAAHALASIKRRELAGETPLEVTEVKMHDKMKALETLAKHLDLVGADVNVTLPIAAVTWEVVDSPQE